jgi:N-hydroxyarylamine O-acetyltransferase
MTPEELDAYLARIGHDGPRTPDLATLRALHRAQASAIPFENVDVLARRGIEIAPDAVRAKLIAAGRGGYCFELNRLFMDALVALGFQVTSLIARVRWMAPPDVVTPRSHMLLRVDLPEGPFIADVGFGGCTQTGPIRLEDGTVQETPLEPMRLVRMDHEWQIEALLGDAWTPFYRFELSPAFPADFLVANWHTSTHPDSVFVSNLMAARPLADHRHTLLNADHTVRWRDGRVERRRLESVDALAEVLRTSFAVPLTDADVAAGLAPHFARWAAAPAR